MADVGMKVREVFSALEVIGRLLIIHTPLPSSADGGASARAGLKLRRIRRVLTEAAEDAQEQREAMTQGLERGGDVREAEKAIAALLQSSVTLSVPELLTRADWDAIPPAAAHVMPQADREGQPVIVQLRKTEFDLEALGPLVADADDIGGGA